MPDTDIAGKILLFTSSASSAAEARSRPETSLVERSRAGDREAFGELYKQYAPMVHGILLLRLPYGEVQDLVQEVFLAAYKGMSELSDPSRFGSWIGQIARNRAAEFYRRRRMPEELRDDLPGPSHISPRAIEVLDAIRSMPDAYRETLVLRLVEGLSGNEIAAYTGRTPDSVRVNLHRGMDMLRKRLEINGAG